MRELVTEDTGAEYRRNLQKAVVKAIVEQSGVDEGNGQRACLIGTVDVCAVLTDLMAGFLASSPECNTPADMRKLADAWRKVFHERLKDHVAGPSRHMPTFGGVLN